MFANTSCAGPLDLSDISHAAPTLALGLFGPGRLALFNAFDVSYRGLAGDKAELGAPAPILAKLVSDRDIDLVVTGTYGHSGLMDVLLGSTAMENLAQVGCDVGGEPKIVNARGGAADLANPGSRF